MADREFECPNDGLRIYRPCDYPLAPNCPACGGYARSVSPLKQKVRQIVDWLFGD